MYTLKNGQQERNLFPSSSSLSSPSADNAVKEQFEASSGSNKLMLYVALIAILLVAIISGWALYKHIKEDKSKVGYSLV
jgi:flagellar biogenesis protein FliO